MWVVGLEFCVEVLLLVRFVDEWMESYTIMAITIKEIHLNHICSLFKVAGVYKNSTGFLEVRRPLWFCHFLAINIIIGYFSSQVVNKEWFCSFCEVLDIKLNSHFAKILVSFWQSKWNIILNVWNQWRSVHCFILCQWCRVLWILWFTFLLVGLSRLLILTLLQLLSTFFRRWNLFQIYMFYSFICGFRRYLVQLVWWWWVVLGLTGLSSLRHIRLII